MLARERLDAVFVLVEPGNLYHVVWHCLDAGIDTFMEKPAGISLFQTESLCSKAADTQRILQVGYNRRHIPLVRHVKKLVEERTEINQVQGTFFKCFSGAFDRGSASALACDVIHSIDLVRWMAGGTAEDVAMIAAQNDDSVLSSWNGLCRFDNGVTGVITSNYRTGGRVHKFEIHGPGVSAYIDLGFGGKSCEAVLLIHEGEPKYSLAARGASQDGMHRIDGREIAGSSEFYRYYGYYFEDRHFVDCVKTHTDPETGIKDAVKSAHLLEMFARSIS